jgi:hypothetical protein
VTEVRPMYAHADHNVAQDDYTITTRRRWSW